MKIISGDTVLWLSCAYSALFLIIARGLEPCSMGLDKRLYDGLVTGSAGACCPRFPDDEDGRPQTHQEPANPVIVALHQQVAQLPMAPVKDARKKRCVPNRDRWA